MSTLSTTEPTVSSSGTACPTRGGVRRVTAPSSRFFVGQGVSSSSALGSVPAIWDGWRAYIGTMTTLKALLSKEAAGFSRP